MNFTANELTTDGFLGGRLTILQPKQGYRSATDAVFLAASTPAKAGQSVLELGCGAGVALACLCRRVGNIRASGIEIQPDYADLARQNFTANNLTADIIDGDLAAMPDKLRQKNFEHVIANPPYFSEKDFTAPADPGKAVAHITNREMVGIWVEAGMRRLRQGGYFTLIHRTEMLPDILLAASHIAGDIKVLPISSRDRRPARRVIIQMRKSAKGPMELLAPLIVHQGLKHNGDMDDYSAVVSGILRNGDLLHIA